MSMKYLTLGAIDIGSNSIRLLISHVIPTPTYTYYKKVSITRLPVRLGGDRLPSLCDLGDARSQEFRTLDSPGAPGHRY